MKRECSVYHVVFNQWTASKLVYIMDTVQAARRRFSPSFLLSPKGNPRYNIRLLCSLHKYCRAPLVILHASVNIPPPYDMRVRALCSYTVMVEFRLARQLLDVLPWHRLMKVAV